MAYAAFESYSVGHSLPIQPRPRLSAKPKSAAIVMEDVSRASFEAMDVTQAIDERFRALEIAIDAADDEKLAGGVGKYITILPRSRTDQPGDTYNSMPNPVLSANPY